VGLVGSSAFSGVFKRSLKDFPAPFTFPKGLVVLANAEKPPISGLGTGGGLGVVGVDCPNTEDRPKTGVVVEGLGDVAVGVPKADTLTGVIGDVICVGLKNGEFLSGAPKTLSPSEKVDCLRLANAPPTGGGLSVADPPKWDGEGLRSSGDDNVTSTSASGFGDPGEEAGDKEEISCWDLLGVLGSGFCWSRIAVGSDFSGGTRTGFGSDSDSTCRSSLSDECAGFVCLEVPEVNREDGEFLQAPKPPDDGVIEADDVGVPNEVWPNVDVNPNAGCPKAEVGFAPKLVCPNPEAGFGSSCWAFDGEGVSSFAWFQFENAPKPGLMVEEPKADVVGVEVGCDATTPNSPSWPFPWVALESPPLPKDRLPIPPSPESIPIDTSLIISEGFRPPWVSPKDESGPCNGEPKLVLLLANALKPATEVWVEPNAGTWPNACWPKDGGFRNEGD
jgi:hypothetical protein